MDSGSKVENAFSLSLDLYLTEVTRESIRKNYEAGASALACWWPCRLPVIRASLSQADDLCQGVKSQMLSHSVSCFCKTVAGQHSTQ